MNGTVFYRAALLALSITIAFGGITFAADSKDKASASKTSTASTKPAFKDAATAKTTDTKSVSTKTADTKSATTKTTNTKSATTKPTDTKSQPTKTADAKPVNLTGAWNIKFTESPTTKTHIMAVKAKQTGNTFTATGVDQYGDVVLNGTVIAPNKISFKRTYSGAQVNPAAQFDGTFTLGGEIAPTVAKGKWSAQPFADKNQKPKASSNSGDWDANIFTGPPISK